MKKYGILLIVVFILTACSFEKTNKISVVTQEYETINSSYLAAKDWMMNNLNPKGYFHYNYNPDKDYYGKKNNMIRQLMMSRVLAYESQANKSLRVLHKKNLDYILEHWYNQEGEYGYVYFSDKSKLGANASLLRVLIHSPFYKEYKSVAEKLYNTILKSQKEDGAFAAWHIEPTYDYDEDYLLTFYSGEALLAMVEYYQKTKDYQVLKATQKSADFYLEKYVDQIDQNYYPAYVPWHSIALNKLYQVTKDAKYAHAIFVMNDRLLQIQNKDADSKYYGRFYNPKYSQYGTPHSSSDGVYTEGLIYAYEIAQQLGDQGRVLLYNNAINRGFENLLDLQYDGSGPFDEVQEKSLHGALRYSEDNYKIRVDTTSHFLDAMIKYIHLHFADSK